VGNRPHAHATVDWRTLPEGVSLPIHIQRDEETYTIGDDVTRKEGVRIGHGSVVQDGSYLGDYATIGDNVIVGYDTIVGSKVKIGDSKRTTIGVGCTLEKGTIIEEGVTIGDGVHVMRGAWIKRGASIGTIIGGTVIGEYAIVGAGVEIQGNLNKVVDGVVVKVPLVQAYRVLRNDAKMFHIDASDWSSYVTPLVA